MWKALAFLFLWTRKICCYMEINNLASAIVLFCFKVLLLQYGLDPNVRFSQKTPHILPAVMDIVSQARSPADLVHVHSLTLALLQYGADPNVNVPPPDHITVCHSQSCVLKKASNHVSLFDYSSYFLTMKLHVT